MSIKRSLRSSILLLSIIPLIIMAILSYIIATTKYANINEENMKKTAKDYSLAFSSKLEAQIIETSALANTNDTKSYLLEKINSPDVLLKSTTTYYDSIQSTFTQLSDNYNHQVNYYLYDIDGYLVISSPSDTVSDWAEVMTNPITYFTKETVIANSSFDDNTLDIVCPVIVKGQTVGLLRTNISPDYFENYISSDKDNCNFIIDKSGHALFGHKLQSAEEQNFISFITEDTAGLSQSEYKKMNNIYTKDRHYNFSYATIDEYDWIYVVKQDASSYTKIVSTLPVLLLVLLCIVTAISIHISESLAIRYTQPILDLSDKMKTATEGQLDVHCDTDWFGEFETLAKNFNKMMDIISANYNEISETQLQLENKQQELLKNYEDIEKIAYTDALTGLYNRMAFYKYANEILMSSKLGKENHAIIFIDLDGFKAINDTLGHDYGDLLLQAVSSKLSSFIDENDLLARNGGDEFVILKNRYQSIAQLEEFLSTLVSIAMHPFVLDDETVHITLSAGAALFPQNGVSLTELMKNADIAMYTSKNSGKNSYTFFNASMEDELNRRNDLIDILRDAIANKNIYLLYQPQADVTTGEIIGCEALMRLNSPIVGYVSPDEFIPVAEESGLIDDLGEWALIEACRFNQRLMEDGFKPIRISVNVSTAQLRGDRLLKAIEHLKQEVSMPLQYLEIELTESVLMKNFEHNLSLIKQMKAMGIRIALDDFGTGYSSFSYLTRIPIDTLKIDKSFIANICNNESDTYIAETIIKLAHKLDIQVVAEGVETIEQLRILQRQTCDVLQGYFFSRAVSENDFIETLKINS